MAITKQPTGLKWTRSGNAVVIEWKIADDNYDWGEYITYQLWSYKQPDAAHPRGTYAIYRQHSQWTPDTKDTSFTIWINLREFYPYTKVCLNGIYSSIKGKKADSDWSATSPTSVNFGEPHAPKLEMTPSNDYDNQSIFTWEKVDDDTSLSWFVDYERQTMLVVDCNTDDGSKLSWGTATRYTGGDTSQTITESVVFDDYHSYTRWYRVRCRGVRGDSPWVYTKRIYSVPAYAENVSAVVQNSSVDRGYTRVNVQWSASPSPAHPIDKTTIDYLETVPASTISTKTDSKENTYRHVELIAPIMSGGTTVTTVKDTTGQVITIPNITALDNCLVVRVNTHHDKNTGTGETKYVTGSFARLKTPTISSVGTLDPDTKRISVSVTNNSEVDNSHIAIMYKSSIDGSEEQCVGIIPHGETSVTIRLPDSCIEAPYTLGAIARLGDYSPASPHVDGYTNYDLSNDIMMSYSVWLSGDVPQPPSKVVLTNPKNGTIRVSWDWTWTEATGAELSWSENEDAWESTTAPSTFIVNNTNASSWNISGLAVGKWYVRIRLLKEEQDTVVYGSYSDLESITLSSAPAIPALTLSDAIIPETGSVTCYWVYVTGDGTAQQQAEICEASFDDESGTYVYGNIIAKTSSAQTLTILAEDQGWKSGEIHYLAVRVLSASGEISEGWSVPVSVTIADKPNIIISNTSLVDITETIESDTEETTYTYKALTSMPLSVTVVSGDDPPVPLDGITTILIERAERYHIEHPDEKDFDGFEGETIAVVNQNGSGQIYFDSKDLMGLLNDGASYNLIAISTDTYGQTVQSEPLKFTVRWEHKAVIPSASLDVLDDYEYVVITPDIPDIQDYDASGDRCDIYRLSTDKPVLLVENAELGTIYADPYPTLKQFGGYRIVYKTFNGDCITEDNRLAWTDYELSINRFATIIDFEGDRVSLPYNLSLNNSWSKDFTETKYLGGSVQGDWNPSVSRTGSVKTTTVVIEDPDTIRSMRRLAEFAGICHVRTPDGSNFTANIMVTEDREEKWITQLAKFSLSFTKVDPENMDGILYSSLVPDNE